MENETLQIQVKASDNLNRYAMVREHAFSFTVTRTDFRLWCDAMLPTFLILYDASTQEGYWLDIQDYAAGIGTSREKYIRLRVPRNNVLGIQTILYMRERKLAAIAPTAS